MTVAEGRVTTGPAAPARPGPVRPGRPKRPGWPTESSCSADASLKHTLATKLGVV